MILADHEIKALCVGPAPMITQYQPTLVRQVEGWGWPSVGIGQGSRKVISYGASSAGYDIRASHIWWEFTPTPWWTRIKRALAGGWLVRDAIDPKAFDPKACMRQARTIDTANGNAYLMPPHSYALTYSVEGFNIPEDVLGVCVGKSTYARSGLAVNVTPLEPGWQGETLVIEVSNTTPRPLLVYAHEGIAQILFHRLPTRPTTTYADRGGKYQGQTGLTFAKV